MSMIAKNSSFLMQKRIACKRDVTIRLQHMKSKRVQQLHTSPRNSDAMKRRVKSCTPPTTSACGGVR